ncbi:hypothetical protein [Rhizobium sp. Root483D2]|uniref:hypothetical protein n=1 Tax=Rhizobium sp. Root483D2 TaxID=1736545 RepID=UPI0007163265|nr:hypothetical protein [Rhizobium sp. Root483D2]KQY22563.1 hypothetical protein ASD32_27070 [Rhizobium sp. Root483D2]
MAGASTLHEAMRVINQIADVVKEEGGGWMSCTGCHETIDGQETGHYPWSNIFSCITGYGCRECGGIGVRWNEPFPIQDAEAMMPECHEVTA